MAMLTTCSHGKLIPLGTTCDCNKQTVARIKREPSDVDKLRNTHRWKRIVQPRIIERDGCVCQRCLIKYGIITTSKLSAHHIKPASKYIELFFDESNLVCLCMTCNRQLGTREQLDFNYEIPNEYEYKL